MLSSRFGTRPVILISGFALAVVLPWLAIAATPITLGVTLLLFGATLGSLDVAMNIHALYSLGGFAGVVLVIAVLAAITFLAEGALLITGNGLVDVKQGGIGYMLFSIAMAGLIAEARVMTFPRERVAIQCELVVLNIYWDTHDSRVFQAPRIPQHPPNLLRCGTGLGIPFQHCAGGQSQN